MNKIQLYKKAKNIVNSFKVKAEENADAVLEDCFNSVRFKTNYQNIKNLEFEIAKAEFDGNSTTTQKELLKVLKKERATILKELNLSEEDFAPKYNCKKCDDTGVYENQTCVCVKKVMADLINKQIGVLVDKTHNFKNSEKENKLTDKNKKIYEKINLWCEKYPDTKYKNLILCGKTGVGKTYLTECIINSLSQKFIPTLFVTSFGLNNTCLKYHTTFDNTKAGILEPLLSCDVLVIDDLGTEPILKNVTAEYLYLIINERAIHNLTTIVTTNLSPNDINNRYGERIFSRLFNKANSLALSFDGSDLRIKK